jgi:CBS domain-containing protein
MDSDISGTVDALLRDKSPVVCSIAPDATVFDAIKLMADRNIGALPVLFEGKLVGLISERDYTRNVILKGKSSKNTAVQDIMTPRPIVVSPNDTVGNCMRLMTTKRVRHLPVVHGGMVVGILSIGDLVKWIISQQEATIDQLTKYVFGE